MVKDLVDIGSDQATILLCERGKIAGVPGKGLIRWVLLRCGLFSIQLSLMVDWADETSGPIE